MIRRPPLPAIAALLLASAAWGWPPADPSADNEERESAAQTGGARPAKEHSTPPQQAEHGDTSSTIQKPPHGGSVGGGAGQGDRKPADQAGLGSHAGQFVTDILKGAAQGGGPPADGDSPRDKSENDLLDPNNRAAQVVVDKFLPPAALPGKSPSPEALDPLPPAALETFAFQPAPVRADIVGVLAQRGYHAEARALADELVRSNPGFSPAYRARGVAALAADKPEEAAADLRRSLALDPGDRLAARLLPLAETRIAMRAGGGSKAAAAAKGVGERLKAFEGGGELEGEGPARPSHRASGGPAAAGPGPASPAAQPGVSDAGRSLVREAQAARQMGEVPKALALADRAVALNPRHCDALNLRADLNARLKRYDRTAQDATNSLAHCPDNLPALNLRSMAFSRLGQFEPALADAGRSVALAPRNPFGYLNRAEAEEGLGRLREMSKDLRRAAALDARYVARYQAKAREYDLPIEPVTLELDPSLFEDSPAPNGLAQAAKPAPSREPRSRNLVLWMLATLAGGFLIALGLLHSLQGRTSRRRRAAAAGDEEEEERPVERPAPPAAGAGEDGMRLAAPFILRKPIGRGGMGVVYDAWDTALERRVAVKKMREELSQAPAERELFVKEARLVANLVHPSIVSIHSIFEEDGELYLVFEYVDGRTLDAVLREKGRLGLDETRKLLRSVCEALEFAHERRVVHRDLKPSNVMLDAAGRPKVMDFGIARAAKDTLARMSFTNTIAGTPLYMPPEAEQGVVSAAWDVYSLGAMTYELLTGRPPFPGAASGAAKLGRVYERLPMVEGALAGAADEAVHAALDPIPDRRPQTPMKFWAALAGSATPPRSKVLG